MSSDRHRRCRLSKIGHLAGLGIALLIAPASGLDISKLQPQGYVSDFAGVMEPGARVQVERYLERVERTTGAQIAVVTVESLDGDPIEDTANALFRKWGIGAKNKNEGLMLMLAVRDRKSRIEVGYGLEPILPDGFVGSVLREMRPSLREGNYGQAVLAGASQIGQTIAGSKGVSLDHSLARRAPPVDRRGGGLPWPVILMGIIILFALLSRGGGGGGFLTGLLLGNLFSGSSRHRDHNWSGGGWGGGGFGSDSGGGGFGGFGGGDSGGGGASSDW